VFSRPKAKSWFEIFTTISGPLILSAAGTVLAYITFIHEANVQKTQQLQTMVESAVSNDAIKERTAVRLVSYLAKLDEISPSFALSIFGTVARNSQDEKLQSEAYDAIQNLVQEGSVSLAKLDRHDQLEIYCLEAALTPTQYWRQVNLHKIDQYVEQYPADKTLKYLAASKLLALSQDISNPQAAIDILLSLPVHLNSPDVIERAIPFLCKAVKQRSATDASGKDVADYLEAMVRESNASDREGLRFRIRLDLTCALVTKDQSIHESSLREIAQISASNAALKEDVEQLFEGVARNIGDADLQREVETARAYFSLLQEKPATSTTQRS
jgi:hypothetical protein